MFVVPYNKDNPIRKAPWVVFTLMFVNGIVLVLEYLETTALNIPAGLFAAHGFVPAHPTIATAFTSMFLHAGFFHYLGNMFFLWMFGNRVENLIGRVMFVFVYLAGGFGATFIQYLSNPHSTIPLVGASGAISGIVGCYFALFPKSRFDLGFYLGWAHIKTIETTAVWAVLTWFGEQTLLGLLVSATHRAGGVAYWAHAGGFAFGAAIGLMFRGMWSPEEMRRRDEDEPDDRIGPKSGRVIGLRG